MCRLLAVFWDQQEVFTHQNGYHGPHFKSTRGTTQDGIISPTLFNLIVDNMVQNWLALTVEYQLVAMEGLELVVERCLIIFYADDGVVRSRDPEWIQGSLKVFIGLFCRYTLVENAANPKEI